MKFLFALIFLISSAQAFARSQAFFGPSGDSVRIIIQGSQSDRDVSRLFAIMNAAETDGGNSVKKVITFRDREGVEAVHLSCGVSKLISDLGSCTLTLNKAFGMSFDPASKSAAYVISDREEAKRLADLFHIPPGIRDFYIANDFRFKMYFEDSERVEFGILYKGDGL